MSFWHREEPPMFIILNGKTLPRLGYGRHRATYDNGKTVIKIPRHENGFGDNRYEAKMFKQFRTEADGNGVRFARCKLLKDGSLVMEKLMDDYYKVRAKAEFPKWAGYIDCGQVGIDSKGVFKAYDYADYRRR